MEERTPGKRQGWVNRKCNTELRVPALSLAHIREAHLIKKTYQYSFTAN